MPLSRYILVQVSSHYQLNSHRPDSEIIESAQFTDAACCPICGASHTPKTHHRLAQYRIFDLGASFWTILPNSQASSKVGSLFLILYPISQNDHIGVWTTG